MASLTKSNRLSIEEIRKRKKRTLDTVTAILNSILSDHQDIFKKKLEERVKEIGSIIDKMRKTDGCNVDNIEDHMNDIAGARFTCCTIDEIPIVEQLVRKHHQIKKCVVTRDYLDDNINDNGYVAHHLLVTVDIHYKEKTVQDVCEVQIRTLAQDLWAVLSHREMYKKNKKKIPDLVVHDMITMSKLLQGVDRLALSLKKRVREELDKEIKKASPTQKDMLTPENVVALIKEEFNVDVTIDFAYDIISGIIGLNVKSLNIYKNIIKIKSIQTWIEKGFSKFGIPPDLKDKLYFPVLYKTYGKPEAEVLLNNEANNRRDKYYIEISKGVFELKEKGSRPKKK